MQKKRVLLAAAAMMAACSLATGTYRTDIWAEGSQNEIQKKTQKLGRILMLRWQMRLSSWIRR